MSAKLMRLESWATEKYGDDKPSVNTLRRWAREGHIYPTPTKQGRSYYVQANAEYLDFGVAANGTTNHLIGKIYESAKTRRT